MPDMPQIENLTPQDFQQLLESSEILRASELQMAAAIVSETNSAKMLARRLVAKGLLTRWQAGQLLTGWTKLRLGNYRLCQQIGRGAFGRVFLAEHLHLQREVAIKTLSRRYTQRPEIVQQFLDEARQVAALDHRNLVHVLDIDAASDQYYMVMEYVVGQDLRRLVKSAGPLDTLRGVSYLIQAAEGLCCAHRAGIVHRDVGPANLMVDEKDVVKVLGLGVGHLTRAPQARSPDLRLADPVIGEPKSDEVVENSGDYRAPEQRCGDAVGDVRSDVYSLGLTALYLLTGCEPGPEPDRADPDPTALLTGAAAPVVQVITQMTQPDPAQRLPDMSAVAAALRAWADQQQRPAPAAIEAGRRQRAAPSAPSATQPASPAASDEATSLAAEDAQDPAGSAAEAGHRRWLVAASAAVAVIALCSVAATVAYWAGRDATTRPDQQPQDQQQLVAQRDAPRKSARVRPKIERRQRPPVPAPNQSTLPQAGQDDPPAAMEEGVAAPEPPKTESTEPGGSEKKPADEKKPDADKKKPDADKKSAPPKRVDSPPAKRPALAGNPFAAWPDAIELPAPETLTTTCSLGKLDLPDADRAKKLSVQLLGGEHAVGRKGRFTLTADPDRPQSWDIALDAGSGGARPVADVSLTDSELTFAWSEVAEDQRNVVAALGNCVLRVSLDKHLHDLRLRKSQTVAPLLVTLQRPSVDENWPLPNAPDARHVYFEVTKLEDPFPSVYNLDPVAPIIVGEDAKVLVKVGSEKLDDHVLVLELQPDLARTFRLNCRIAFQLTPSLEPISLTQKNLEESARFVSTRQTTLNLQAQNQRSLVAKAPRNEPKRKVLERDLEQIERVLKETSLALDHLDVLNELREAMVKGAAIHFRVYYQADQCEVDLLRSSTE